MKKISEDKAKTLSLLSDIINNYNAIGIVDIKGLPSDPMQIIRKKIRNEIVLKVSKHTLLSKAIESAEKKRKNIENLKNYLVGESAIIATNMSPFKLYKELEKTKIRSAAKGGEEAPEDITVKSGETQLKPGPIVGELQKAGVPAGIEGGKVVIKKDKVLVKAGEKISKTVASILPKMDIYPILLGLKLKGVYEDGIIYEPKDLAIDEEKIKNELSIAYNNALQLSISISYLTSQNIALLLSKAYSNAISLCINANIVNKESIEKILMICQTKAQAIANLLMGGE
ncbi:MAG: 50S ribosomal protein L10 [Candidatus Thermoplasmatota archaeon]